MCEIIVSYGWVDGLPQLALCSPAVFLFGELVHQLCVFGAFFPHHLTSLCLTARVDFKDSLEGDKKNIFCLSRKLQYFEIPTLFSTATYRFGFVAFDCINQMKAIQFHFLQTQP